MGQPVLEFKPKVFTKVGQKKKLVNVYSFIKIA